MPSKRFSACVQLLLLAAMVGTLGLSPATASGKDPPLSVKVATIANFPPQYTLDEADNPTGFAVEVMNQVAGMANLQPEYIVFLHWSEAQQALRSGVVDIIPNMGITEQRREFADFTAPVESFPISIFVRNAESTINTAEDLAGHRVAVVKVNAGHTLLKNRPGIELVIAHSPSEAIISLLAGQADALVYPQPVIDQLARKSGISEKLKVVGEPLQEIARGIAVRKGRADLHDSLDAAVRRFVATDAYVRVYNKWYNEPRSYWTGTRMLTALGLVLAVFLVGMLVMRHTTLSRFNKTLEKRVQDRTAALAASEESFRLLFENASFGIAIHDILFDENQKPVNYTLTNVNPAFYRILGFEPGSAEGRLATDFYGVPEAPFLKQYAALALGSDAINMEIEFSPLGRIFKVSAYSHLPGSFVTVFEDITKRKQTEAELRDVTRKLELAQELGRSGWWEYDVVNDRANWPDSSWALFGIESANMTMDYEGFLRLIHPEYREDHNRQIQKIFDEGRAEFLYPITRPDGETRWIWARGEAEYDENGRPVRLFGIMQDITDRKRLEDAHRENTERLLAIFNTVPVGILLVKDRIVREANPRVTELSGYELAEVVGKGTRQFYIDDDEWKRIGHALEAGLARRNLISIDAKMRHKDGQVKDVLMTCSRLSDETPPTILAALQDITERRQNELRLQESQRRIEAIIDASPIPLVMVDDTGNITYLNPAFINTLGYTLEDIPTLAAWWPKAYPDTAYREQVEREWWRNIEQIESKQVRFSPAERRICRKDGTPLTMLATSAVLSGFKEKTRLVTLFDITQNKIMSERLKTLLATASDGIHVMDEMGNIVEFSDSFARMLGYTPGEAALLNVADWEAQIPIDDLAATIKELMASSSTFETKHRRKDGSLFDAEINAKGIVLDGRLLLYASSRDITERKEAERSLRYYETIASSVDTLLSLVDRNMVFLQVNDALASVIGIKREEIVGKPVKSIVDPKDYARMKAQVKRSLAGETVSREVWIDVPGRQRRCYNITRYPMFDEDGQVYAVAGVGFDITEIHNAHDALTRVNEELKQLNESLRAAKQAAESANRAKSTFLSNMTHELRTPLNAILGYTQILTADKTLGEKPRSGIRTIHQAGEHLLMIINDVLDMSKIEAGKLQLVPSEIQLQPFFQNIIDFFKYRAREKGLAVTFDCDRSVPPAIVADGLRLRQVIFNLLSNAIKFTAKGYCRLHVGATDRGEGRCQLDIAVEDSGVGIPQAQQAEVFDPFKQVGDRLQYKEGSGLGLAISDQLVNLMGGEMVLTSPVNPTPTDGVGVGSRFFFSIEAEVVQADTTTFSQKSEKIVGYAHDGNRHDPVKILIVDDKPSNRAVLRDTLTPLGFATEAAEDGRAVSEICLRTHPDLILMDLRMPNVDGFSAMQQLKHHEALQNIPVVAITASIAETGILEKRCKRHGFRGFVLKPFRTVDLLETIAGLLPITLRYRQEKEPEPDDSSVLAIPPAEMLASLVEFLAKGDIEGILEQAAVIELREGGKYKDYCQIIRTLANDFQFSELEKLIVSEADHDEG